MRTHHAINIIRHVARRLTILFVLQASLAALGLVLLAVAAPRQGRDTPRVLDLTAKVPVSRQGYSGLPGGVGGSWVPQPYRLPLDARIAHSSVNTEGNFIVEVVLRNTGNVPFDLPASQEVAKIQQLVNASKRIFFIRLLPIGDERQQQDSVGFAQTAGSPSAPGSFLRLQPGDAVRVLVAANANLVRQSLAKMTDNVEIKAICGEWNLANDRYFVQASAQDLSSSNTALLGFRDRRPMAIRP